ncbi:MULTISPECIES: PEP-CTERM sorting domain-containing protein [unclassified Coleofasciculus]|uniref:PEP-CTERM sorting domain-containing protein n=1 Tax=unclassified Coleofasciculus TaxID=2692782 RepID=UPI00187E471A|nr:MULTISPECIES: PEP-CTERM sorting domain-containing protein [unclassified Coleofasciculus]MBE9125360.1 PEP-CTERM sorting domain-containing protein [Coleofasciculus sp. LEGE 07081]MBE9148563.1 PEP-CTERM sorting domain-containing protein [Coleofasciculus sp. LEGE 07092]
MRVISALALGTACSLSLGVAVVQPAFAVSEVEPNDPFFSRQFLPSDTNSVEGFLNSGDVDFFTLSGLNAGSLFTAEITSGSFDSILGFLDDFGNILETDDDGGSGLLSLLTGTVPASGNLNLGVTGFADFGLTGNHFQSGSYTLSLETFTDVPVSNYTAMEVPFIFDDISDMGTRVLAGADDTTTSADLGFTFNFYGNDYNSVSWSPNGLMTFGGSNSQFSNVNLTTTAPFNNLPSIAVLWDDWQFFSPGTDASYFYTTMGTEGNRRFITQWNFAEGFSDSPSPVTFQSVLFEGSNNILFSYLDVNSGDFRAFGNSATVGIRDVNGHLNGKNVQWSFNSPTIRNQQSILFKPASVPEPASTLGLLAFGAFSVSSLLKRKQEQKM